MYNVCYACIFSQYPLLDFWDKCICLDKKFPLSMELTDTDTSFPNTCIIDVKQGDEAVALVMTSCDGRVSERSFR